MTRIPAVMARNLSGVLHPRVKVWVVRGCFCLCLAYLLLGAVLLALAVICPFNGYPADGAFQLFNPLRRIAAGQTAGIDFQFFHGLLTAFIHYPIFSLFGKTVFASEFSRQFLSVAFFILIPCAAFLLVVRPRRHALGLAILAIAATDFVTRGELALPANSLLGIRSSVPLLFLAAALSPSLSIRKRPLILGILAGIALSLGTEHGVALMLGYLATQALYLFSSRVADRSEITLRNSLFAVSAIGSLLFITALLSKVRGTLSVLWYNFHTVPQDQYWFFGSPPSWAPSRLGELFIDPAVAAPLLLAVSAFVLSAVLLFTSPRWRQSLGEGVSAGLAYCVLSFAPYMGRGMRFCAYPAVRVLIFLVLIVTWNYRSEMASALSSRLRLGSLGTRIGSACSVCLVVLAAWQLGIRSDEFSVPALSARFRQLAQNRWEPRLGPGWSAYVGASASLVGSSPSSLWATYGGILHASRGMFNPAPDYIIHALGADQRIQYLDTFRSVKPEFVETLSVDFFPLEEWLHNTTWPFYQDLLEHYRLEGRTYHSLIWRRDAAGSVVEDGSVIAVRDQGPWQTRLMVDGVNQENRLFVVDVSYACGSVFAWVPFLGDSGRCLITWEGTQSQPATGGVNVPPYASEFRFPLIGSGVGNITLKFETRSALIPQAFDRRSVTVKALRFRDPDVFAGFVGSRVDFERPDEELKPFKFTDANWKNGIWINLGFRKAAGFFVRNSSRNRQRLADAATLIFGKSGARGIISREANGPYLNIFVDGPPLDPDGDGYPNVIGMRK